MSSSKKTKSTHMTLQKLWGFAVSARTFSHSPYSRKKVGSAILFSDGSMTTGCNIENASYGGTVCAERVAIWNGVSQKSKLKISHVVVAVDEKEPWPPCGFCLQVISEFSTPKTKVTCVTVNGRSRTFKLKDLLPQAFLSSHL